MKFFYRRLVHERISEKIHPDFEMIDPFYLPNCADGFFFGSIEDMHKIQKLGYQTKFFCNFENFKYTTYSKYYFKYLLNTPYLVVSFEDLQLYRDDIFACFGVDGTIFMRPDNGDKPFTGMTIYREDFTKELFSIENGTGNFDKSTLCIISHPKQYNKFSEYRTWVVDNKVVEASSYRINGFFDTEAKVPSKVIDYAQNVVDNVKWQPDPAFVLDIVDNNGVYSVVELNSMSCSGMYNASIVKICEALKRYFGET